MSSRLRDLAEVHYGKSPNEVISEDSTVPIIGTGGIYGRASRSLFNGPAVVVARKGTLGNLQFVDEPFWPVDTTYAVLAKPGVDTKWLYYSLAAFDLTKLNEATGVPSISRDWLYKVSLGSTDFVAQRRIAEILSTLDEAIEQTEALIAKHQQIKAGLMHDLFTRGVTPAGHLRPTREQAPDLYKESPLGWIPKEWEVVTTEDCAAKMPGSTTIGPFGSDLISSDYRSEGVPVVFVRDVKEDAFEWNSDVFVTHEKSQRLSAHAVRPGDLLSTKMGLPPCVCCEYPDWMEQGIITADIIRLRPDSANINTRWLSAALNSDAFKRQVQAITAGVTRPKVTLADFRKLRLARPELAEQTMFANRLASLADMLSSEEAKLVKLQKQKHGLMHDLLTGHVRVKFSEKRVTRG